MSGAFAGYKLGGMAVAFAATFLGFILGLATQQDRSVSLGHNPCQPKTQEQQDLV